LDEKGIVQRRNWIKFVTLGVFMAGALAYLFFSGMKTSMVYYRTLEELESAAPSRIGESVRLAGWVKEDSVRGPVLDGGINFVMTDGKRELLVLYSGQIPDTFKEGSEVVLEGVYKAQPVFVATTLLAKCPSKYEAEGYDPDKKPVTGDKPL
jgi:cytochrome c-type biogenesis protein CcmE